MSDVVVGEAPWAAAVRDPIGEIEAGDGFGAPAKSAKSEKDH